jgi:hypothetical protein
MLTVNLHIEDVMLAGYLVYLERIIKFKEDQIVFYDIKLN